MGVDNAGHKVPADTEDMENEMAIPGGARFPVAHDQVFPKGALVMGVEPVMRFQTAEDRARGRVQEQETDKETGERLWAVTVIDQSAERKADAVVTVKIAAPHQPVPPEAIPGTDLRPVVFEGLTVTPWIDDKACRPAGPGDKHRCRARMGYSLRAREMKPVSNSGGASKTTAKAA
ncbi:hypothetical protein [Gandjariella thermophila]|uniref:Plasmid replication, integration and excision activator n=1 Tax=Gandjariella thermophila TaxID=1931992 RepID=A0A4D4JCB7_9PSEU|nr:hypothetical protein [Gandjariella thermophila]GDY33002.1 hypothetical protein GTS_46350 [Gandjariella thermophila]